MTILTILVVWLLALIYLTNYFRRQERVVQQRIFSVFLIIWAILGVIYYDVWAITSEQMNQLGDQWQTYLPAAFFSICAGLGTYYLLQTFGKFRAMAQKNQREADQQRLAKENRKKSKTKAAKK